MDSQLPCDKLDAVPSYQEFLDSYLLPNKPVIIGPSLISSWHARNTWRSEDGTIDWERLQADYGHCRVTVADCSTRDFGDQRREQLLFRDVVSLWQQAKGETLYVKDWHLARTLLTSRPSQAPPMPFYTTPDIFRDDWMNAYYSACTEDDFRFVYVGAAGTFTPLHRDVYTSYSWSTNVCGRKRWWLFPPDQTPLLFRKGGEEHLETAYDVRSVDPTQFPQFNHARPIVIEQGDGETIFVYAQSFLHRPPSHDVNFVLGSPSGWYHQVENLTACISINHNWCNSINLPSLYESMCAKVTEVEHALEDVQELLSRGKVKASDDASSGWKAEWISIVQDVVEKDAGWNWLTFWKMVRHAFCLAAGRSYAVDESLWDRTPPELMPPLDFMMTRTRSCYDDFVARDQLEIIHVSGLKDVLSDIRSLLDVC